MNERDPVLEQLRIVYDAVRHAGKAHVAGDTRRAIGELDDARVLLADVLVDLRETLEEGSAA